MRPRAVGKRRPRRSRSLNPKSKPEPRPETEPLKPRRHVRSTFRLSSPGEESRKVERTCLLGFTYQVDQGSPSSKRASLDQLDMYTCARPLALSLSLARVRALSLSFALSLSLCLSLLVLFLSIACSLPHPSSHPPLSRTLRTQALHLWRKKTQDLHLWMHSAHAKIEIKGGKNTHAGSALMDAQREHGLFGPGREKEREKK